MRFLSLVLVLFSLTIVQPTQAATPWHADDVALVEGLPSIGKWLLDSNGQVAHWLEEKVGEQLLNEPVNVILRVKAASEGEAEDALVRACKAAGFESRRGHSTGYSALIGGGKKSQLPRENDHAYSDAVYLVANNHGRFFGPLRFRDQFIFVGAFSREGSDIMRKLKGQKLHFYISFQQARDELANQLERKGGARRIGPVPLGNALLKDAPYFTGDHDGSAVLLEL